ncbi:hypothetical protein NESM_000232300 [Novymonas esmeraldas]|uniref:Uncharacterized protein n=1 Tax=Novymonas esmeraldas TaxID=1808958 RepID=A0AAW0FAI8_9TRYP
MEGGSGDVAAALLAGALASGVERAEKPSDSRAGPNAARADAVPGRRRVMRTPLQALLEDQRRFALRDGAAPPVPLVSSAPGEAGMKLSSAAAGNGAVSVPHLPDMFGRRPPAATPTNTTTTAATVETALQDAVLRWGPAAQTSAGGTTSSPALHVRRSWRLVEAAPPHAVPTTATSASASTAVSSRSIGQRWERVEDVVQVNALAHAVWHESALQHALAGSTNTTTTTTVAAVGAVPASASSAPRRDGDNGESTAAAEQPVEDGQYAAGLLLCHASTCSSASLAALLSTASWDDHHDAQHDDHHHLRSPIPPLAFFTFTAREYDAIAAPPTARFTYASSCHLVQLWSRFGNPVVVVDRWLGPGCNGGGGGADAWVPSVEAACAEYHRVLTGVLQGRRQRLLEAVAEPTRSGGDGSGGCAGSAAPRHVHPFVASFDRYAVLQHRATAANVVGDGSGGPPAPSREHGTTARDDGSSSPPPPSQPSPSPSPRPPGGAEETCAQDGVHDSTPSQRFAAHVTPHPWYAHGGEVQRRTHLARLLRQEQRTNVPYQEAASRYCALAASAATALQRVVFAFYGSDDADSGDDDEADAAAMKREDGKAPLHTTTTPPPSGSSSATRRLRRHSFAVELQPLPGVDASVWRTAEATVRKAAEDVLNSRKRRRGGATTRGSVSGARGRRAVVVVVRGSAADDDAAAAADASGQRSRSGGPANDHSSGASADDDDDSAVSEGEADHDHGEAASRRSRREGRPLHEPPRTVSPTRHSLAEPAARHSAHLSADATYAALQAYLADVLPFRCHRLRGAVQAGWLLPPPTALPQTLTDPITEDDVLVLRTRAPAAATSHEAGEAPVTSEAAPPPITPVASTPAVSVQILTEDEYRQLRRVNAAAVCNRVVSHTGEAVLLSLPPAVPRLHREVEQELERYLYDDTSALMEVTPVAQSLVGAIRLAYTQNTLLHRLATRLEHALDALKKVSEECEVAAAAAGTAAETPPSARR